MLKVECPNRLWVHVKQDEYTGLRLQELMFTMSVNVKLNCFYEKQRYGQTRTSLT